jgi:hypothetical protein
VYRYHPASWLNLISGFRWVSIWAWWLSCYQFDFMQRLVFTDLSILFTKIYREYILRYLRARSCLLWLLTPPHLQPTDLYTLHTVEA